MNSIYYKNFFQRDKTILLKFARSRESATVLDMTISMGDRSYDSSHSTYLRAASPLLRNLDNLENIILADWDRVDLANFSQLLYGGSGR